MSTTEVKPINDDVGETDPLAMPVDRDPNKLHPYLQVEKCYTLPKPLYIPFSIKIRGFCFKETHFATGLIGNLLNITATSIRRNTVYFKVAPIIYVFLYCLLWNLSRR